MDMVECWACKKPIAHTHLYRFEIIYVNDDPLNQKIGLVHVNCDDPIAPPRNEKPGPKFETKTPNQRQIAQEKLYKAV